MKAPDVIYVQHNTVLFNRKVFDTDIAYARVRELTDDECDYLNTSISIQPDIQSERKAIRAWLASIQGEKI